ncbi:MAG TPA: hypothetical protein VGQ14_06825 [Candidatus Eisenbacteria bacterium]|nr:hypothetical protein [Candidatus Eisenbacteria bacterium]
MNIEVRRAPSAFLTILAVAVGLVVAGCGSDNATGPKMVPLTVKAQGVGGGSRLVAAPNMAAAAVADTDTMVTYTRALLSVRDVRFVLSDSENGEIDSTGTPDDSTDVDSDHEDAGQIRYHGPFVIDLLAGSAQDLGTQMVPAGIYHHVMGHLQKLVGGGDLANTYPDLVGATVLLEGDIHGDGGGHFIFESRIDTEFIIHGSFQVTGDTPVTSYLVFDLSQFLRGNGGVFLDPRDPANENAIRVAIKQAVKTGIDEDHDGEPDEVVHH